MINVNIQIISTLHDPNARLINIIRKSSEFLIKGKENIIVACTKTTHKLILDELRKMGLNVIISPDISNVETYLTAIKAGLKKCNKKKHFFYCDFDRLLHWRISYPEELYLILKDVPDQEFLHIGRTKRAFNTHPITQSSTEIIINKIGSKLINTNRIHDIISVCWIMSHRLAHMILTFKNTNILGFYALWPILLWKKALSAKYIEVEGQEWETPDRYKREIEEIGYNNWLKQFQNSSEFMRRIDLMSQCLDSIMEIANITIKL